MRLSILVPLVLALGTASAQPVAVEPTDGRLVYDADALDRRTAALYSVSDVAGFVVPDGLAPVPHQIAARARGTRYRGWPRLRVKVEGRRVGAAPVRSAAYVEVAVGEPVDLRPGDRIEVTFPNDRSGPDGDRNLFVDRITLAPTAPPPGARPVTRARTRPVRPEHIGVNIDRTIRGVARDSLAYNEALAELRPGTIRFPGGTVSNYWDWERADFVCGEGEDYFVRNSVGQAVAQPCELPNGYQVLDPPRHTLEAFKTELDETGAAAVFVLNMMTERAEGDPTRANDARRIERQLAMLRAARDLGIEVRYVELGNELYLAAGARDASNDYITAYPNPGAYARQARRWLDAVEAEFPDAEVAAVGSNTAPDGSPRRNGWNDALYAELGDRLSAVTLHSYVKTEDYPKRDSTDVPSFLAMAQTRMDDLLAGDLARVPGGVAVWVSEYNAFADDMTVQGTWAHGLFVAAQTLGYLRADAVALSHVHSGIGDAVFGALFNNDRGFAFSGWPAPPDRPVTVPFGKSASGETLQLVGEVLRGASMASELAFGADAPTLPGGAAALVGWEATAGGETRVVVLNLSDADQTVDLGALVPGGTVVQRSAAPLALVTGAGVAETAATLDGPLALPAYSVTLVRSTPPSLQAARAQAGAPPSGLAVAPNPARSRLAVSYAVEAAGPVRVVVHDIVGRAVATLADGTVAAGTHRTSLDLGGVAPGVYLVRLETAAGVETARVTVVR